MLTSSKANQPKPLRLLFVIFLSAGVGLGNCAGPVKSRPNRSSPKVDVEQRQLMSGHRPLTRAEIDQLQGQLSQTIATMPERIKGFPIYADQRTQTEKQRILAFQQAWAKVNPSIAPFLGQRSLTHPHLIFPSRRPGRVCVFYGSGSPETSLTVKLSVAQVRDGKIYTHDHEILFLEGPYLVTFYVEQDNTPALSLLPHPKAYTQENGEKGNDPLRKLAEQQLASLQKQLQPLGCTTGLP